MTNDIVLPEGWTKESIDGTGRIVVSTQCSRHVTISFKDRWWSLGHAISVVSSMPGCSSKGTRYSGRFWRKELVEDALLALNAIVNE